LEEQFNDGATLNWEKFIGVHRCGHKLLIVAVGAGSIAYLNPQLVKVIFEGVG
jgi:hypothetical protein